MAADLPPEPFRFNGFVLDPARGVLLGADGAERTLRPKSYALLLFLLENAGRLVDRDRILAAVWPGVFVTDDSITQCVGEVRRALGEEGAGLLRTVPRRGYLFGGEVSRGTPPLVGDVAPRPDQPALASSASLAEASEQVGQPSPAVGVAVAKPIAAGRNRGGRWGLAVAAGALLLLAGAATLRPAAPPGAALVRSPSEAVTVATGTPPATARERAEVLYRQGRDVFYRRATDSAVNWLEARAMFEQAIAADPSYALPYAEAVFTYTNMVLTERSLKPAEDLATAERLAERATALAPGAHQSFVARAAVMRNQGRWEEALAAYRRAVEIDGTQNPSRANAGMMLILLGRAAEAEGLIRTALALAGPQHRNAFEGVWLGYLGLIDLYLERNDHGVEAFRIASELGSGEPPDIRRLLLAAALARNGQEDEARALAAPIAARRPDLGVSWFRRRALSSDPTYSAQRERLYEGLAAAGVAEGDDPSRTARSARN